MFLLACLLVVHLFTRIALPVSIHSIPVSVHALMEGKHTNTHCYPFFFAECEGYLVLFRTYVSRNSAGKGKAVLEKVGFDPEIIEACYGRHPLKEEEAVQDGLIKWSAGYHGYSPTWKVLLEAMVYAGIAQRHYQGLKEELYHLSKSECVFVICSVRGDTMG